MKSSEEIATWMRDRLATVLKIPVEDIDPAAPLEKFGLDSATAVSLTLDLEDWLGRPVEPAIFYDHPTIQALAEALAVDGGAS